MSENEYEEIKVEKGMGIWGNDKCVQCGACCYEWNKYLFEIEARTTEKCENFTIKDGKAYCLAHEGDRKRICGSFFCGDTDFYFRFRCRGDENLRKIAEMLGTVPENYKIPKLLPKILLKVNTY
jgi:hypothetical protein